MRDNKKIIVFDRLDDPESVATPHICWGGRTFPARNSFTSLILSGLLVVTRIRGHRSYQLSTPV
jgi:hypothetical protein